MIQKPTTGLNYFCPMHADMREPKAGKCPRCRMDLLAKGTRFGMLRHIISSPMHPWRL